MADQKHRSIVLLQKIFQQFQRIDIEVIGRLVQHQHVGRSGKQACQQQPVAFTPRQGPHGGVRTGW